MLASPVMAGLNAVAEEIAAIAGPGARRRDRHHRFGILRKLSEGRRRRLRSAPCAGQQRPPPAPRPGKPEAAGHLRFWAVDPVLYRETVEVNIAGTFFMSRTVTPYFIEMGYGKIINLTTSLRNFYSLGQSPYGVTKAAIDASTYIWARDLEGKGVTVNALLPGGACDNGDVNRPPEPGRTLLPADIMNPLLVWMCSARSDGATGTRFVGALWENSLDPDQAAAGCLEDASIRGAGA